jgi:hypothetical protein
VGVQVTCGSDKSIDDFTFFCRKGNRCRWEYNVKMDLKKIGCAYVDWILLVLDRYLWQVLVKTVMNIWVP